MSRSKRWVLLLAAVLPIRASLPTNSWPHDEKPPASGPRRSIRSEGGAPADWFRKVNPSGLEGFHQLSGGAEKRYIFEATSGGVCVLDFDNDGWMDLYFVNGGTMDTLSGKPTPITSRLFRNDHHGGFEDVTARAGVSNSGAWGQGCSAADYDNDGWVDLYVTNIGPNRLYHNNGDGTFTEVATQAGVADPRWSTGAAWADYDGDGYLDLYVANYVDLSPTYLPLSLNAGGQVEARFCEFLGHPVFCGPRGLRGAQDALYHNNGNGTFTEVTREAGLEESTPSYGFQPAWADFDGDGKPDLFVANDSTPNYLYHNEGGGKFREIGYLAGVAVSGDGREQANMGVAVGDYDGDGLPDIFITHFSHDSNTLYHNLGNNTFDDVTSETGLGEPSIPYLGWGTFFFDFDNDGLPDILVANGHVYPQVDTWESGTSYLERRQLFRNIGGKFREVTAQAGEALIEKQSSRGAAFLDFDNDGRLDIVINNLDGQPTLLHNELNNGNHYLTLRLISGRRDAVGARVLLRASNQTQGAEVQAGSSYLSQNDPRLHFGLGAATTVQELRVRWPDGKERIIRDVSADQILTLRE